MTVKVPVNGAAARNGLRFLRFFLGARVFVLLVYFIAQVSSGLHGSLNIGVVGRLARRHLSKQDCCSQKNQVILFHAVNAPRLR